VKAARKTGRISARMAESIGRTLRSVVDGPALRRAIDGASATNPATTVRAVREAVKIEKADDLFRLTRNVGEVQAKAGTRAALDGLKISDSPREMARVAKLAEKQGGKTRAVLNALLEKYADGGIKSVKSLEILKVDPLTNFGTPVEIVNLFGSKQSYLAAIQALAAELYREAA
jgi:hypothetical protein